MVRRSCAKEYRAGLRDAFATRSKREAKYDIEKETSLSRGIYFTEEPGEDDRGGCVLNIP